MQKGLSKNDIARRLCKIAYAKPNDAVKLACQNVSDIDSLDLMALTELKKAANGVVEMKFFNRMEAFKLLLETAEGDERAEAERFFGALYPGGADSV